MNADTIPSFANTIPVTAHCCDYCGTEDPFHAEDCSEIYCAATVRAFKAAPNKLGWCLWCGENSESEYCCNDCYNAARADLTYIEADVAFGGGSHG